MPISCYHNTLEVYAQTPEAMVSKLNYGVNSKATVKKFLLNYLNFWKAG